MTKQILTFIVIAVSLMRIDLQAAATTDISRELKNREKIYDTFSIVTKTLSNLKKRQALDWWVAAFNKEAPVNTLNIHMKNFKQVIKNKQLIQLMIHFDTIGQKDNRDLVIRFYFHALSTWVYNVGNNPVYKLTKGLTDSASSLAEAGFSHDPSLAKCLSGKSLNSLISCLKKPALTNMIQFAKKMLSKDSRNYYFGPAFVKSYAGYIGGNKITYLNQNPSDQATIEYIGGLKPTMAKYIDMTVNDFKAKMSTREAALTEFFNESNLPSHVDPETLEFSEKHKIYQKSVPGRKNVTNIFGDVMNSIENAKESIFIDIFFLGGSMGAYMAKKLIRKVQTNKDLKIFFITDRYNGLGYAYELDYVFNYLRAYSEKFPEDRLFVLGAEVTAKRTALPDFMDLLIDDSTLEYLIKDNDEMAAFVKQMDTYPKAKADHSKVFIIDGMDDKKGVAYLGSKNYTDSSGAISYDEVVKIEGPATKVALDSYYYDLYEAMATDYKNTNGSYLNKMYKKITTKKAPANKADLIAQLLAPLDVLGRHKTGYSIKNIDVKASNRGEITIQLGQNDVYGTIRSALPQDIETILQAKKQIVISDQFLYDPMIIEAIADSVRRDDSEVKVFVMLEPLSDRLSDKKELRHLPNTIFLAELKAVAPDRIHLKWKRTPDTRREGLRKAYGFVDNLDILTGQKNVAKATQLADTYHLKTLSIDGVKNDMGACSKVVQGDSSAAENSFHTGKKVMPVLISGSANKDFMTMKGGFREFQAVLYNDKESVAIHDCLFWERWNDDQQSVEIDPHDFTLPAKLAEKGITPEDFLGIIKNLVLSAYNYTEKIISQ